MSKTTLTEEEIRARHKFGIGGSEVAAIYGLSPWQTALGLWMLKTGRTEPQEANEAMRIGSELEDLVARMFTEKTGRAVCRWKAMLKEGPIIGNVDRLVYGPNGEMPYKPGTTEICAEDALECKTASSPWSDGVPFHYQLQVQHYMALMPTVKRFHIAVLDVAHKAFDIHVVERNDEAIASIREVVPAWWEKHVVHDEAPLPASEDDCRKMFKAPAPKPVHGNPLVERAAEYLAKCESAGKLIEAEAEKARTFLMAYIGDMGDTLVGHDGQVLATWKASKGRTTTAWKDIALELGATREQIEAHSTTGAPTRRFLLKVQAAPFEYRNSEFLAESDEVRKEIAESGIAI